ncbi:MAG: TraR/DksA family transcriptional regulator [Ferruginibacter sp.]|nr:TraR/DksA family transcriptional regulator [Ferruginibacter sp.]
MATKKKGIKAAPKKATTKTSKKTPAKPVKKAKPVAKKVAKPIAKKATPKKKIAKPVAKKVTKPVAKAVVKKTVKKVTKPVAKKVVTQVKKGTVPAPKKKETPVLTKAPSPKIAKVSKPIAIAPKAIIKPKHIAPKANATNIKDIKVIPAKTVHIPKITTKTSRAYKPEFGKSLLDSPIKSNPGAPLVRYSDSELAEFKEIIERKLDSARKELAFFQGLITRKGEMGSDESENRYITMEDGSESAERERQAQMISRAITFIDHLEKALIRIENKTYGVCRITGKLIEKARLRAVPHATLSYEAKMMNSNK